MRVKLVKYDREPKEFLMLLIAFPTGTMTFFKEYNDEPLRIRNIEYYDENTTVYRSKS